MHEAATRAATQDADRLRQEQGQLQQRIVNDAETAAKAAQAQAQQQNAKVAMLNVKLNAATTTCHGKETALAEARVQLDLVSKKAQQLEQGLAGEKKKSHSLQQEFDTFKSMHDSISQAKASEAEQSLRKQLEDLTVVRDELGKLNQIQKDALVSSLLVAVDGLIVPAKSDLLYNSTIQPCYPCAAGESNGTHAYTRGLCGRSPHRAQDGKNSQHHWRRGLAERDFSAHRARLCRPRDDAGAAAGQRAAKRRACAEGAGGV